MAAYDAVSVSVAIDRAHAAFPAWTAREVDERAGMLERLGDSLEEHRDELMALCIQEAFKSIPDAIAEVREAVDFCRSSAAPARDDLHRLEPPGTTGEPHKQQSTESASLWDKMGSYVWYLG